MKIPKTIKIAGHLYRTKIKNGTWSGDTMSRGQVNTNVLAIKLDKNMPKSRKGETLVHEIIHAIYHEYGLEDTDKEERIVSVLSTGLYQVLVDNPKLKKIFDK